MTDGRRRIGNWWIWALIVVAIFVAWHLFNFAVAAGTT